ncbi:RraA family protein [Streptomyces sp. NPDC002838]|uniref:RraA family protein n=1 Tax=Streptomyces sp. NPDC002838 TaxID=3154436 RepID=UPI00331B7DB6
MDETSESGTVRCPGPSVQDCLDNARSSDVLSGSPLQCLNDTVNCSTIADAMDVLGRDGGVTGLRRLTGEGVVVGRAFTLRYEVVTADSPGTLGDFVDDVPAGAVIVIDNGGRDWCSVWGDLVSTVAHARGVAGTVIDGACRDVAGSAGIGYSIWAASTCVKSGRGRVRLAAVLEPVMVRGVTVHPGDWVCADESGIVVVPAETADAVATEIRRIDEMEERVLAAVRGGAPLSEARAANGYLRLGVPGNGGTA